MMRALLGLALLLAFTGCATASRAEREGSLVVAEPPHAHCKALGPMTFKGYSDVLMSEDALLATAVVELQRRTASLGATHLVVDCAWFPATVAYGNVARASAQAYRCEDDTR